jgi:hypothetical protein
MSWEDWLLNNGHSNEMSAHDRLLEMAIDSYGIRDKNRKMEIIDRKHFLVLWWKKNQDYLNKYNTMTSLARLININHATVNHYEKHRKKSRLFNENTDCIRDFLNS